MNDTHERRIKDYVRRLSWSLQRLEPADRRAIGAEIRSHLHDCAADGDVALDAALAGLGSPYHLARRYLEENALVGALGRVAPARLLLAIVDRAGRSVLAFAAASVGLIAYLLAAAIGIVVFAKPIVPDRVGLWHGADGWQAGLIAAPPGAGSDMLGFWIMPTGVVLALGLYLVATRVLRLAGHRLLRHGGA
ncbi:DUF1700 domain-containing protein [Sphingomonas sp. CROZ-RG-20F-R02-07]|uniref:DUF1700 domain-containing protein n=1 Tax=Sphingomonas sp. CROZ-RG-20F-R02-07 TaxID=2914832 RepID=UPI001F5A9E24|nr:DUF1700 domain-containing protein [Sphingomonas sp. CROZ-RG-20F-R02-07]